MKEEVHIEIYESYSRMCPGTHFTPPGFEMENEI